MNKFFINILFLLSFCFSTIVPDYFVLDKNVNDHHSIGFNSSYINYSSDSSKFKITFDGNSNISNNSISLDWLNNSLLGGLNLRNDKDKANFLSIFEQKNISISSFAQAQFGFSYKDCALLLSPQSFGNMIFPYSAIDFMFYGLDFSDNISFDTDKSQFQAVIPISFAHSRNMDQHLDKFNLPINNIRFGLSTKLLLGLAFFETNFSNSNINSSDDLIELSGDIQSSYSLFGSRIMVDQNEYGNSELELGSNFGFSGTGFALDFGLSADYLENINIGLSLNNIFGKVNWNSSSTYEYNMSYDLNLSSDEFEAISEYNEEQQDSLISSIIIYESNKKITNSKKTDYPSYLLLNGNYTITDYTISSHILIPFNDAYYNDIELNAGFKYNRFEKIPLYFQLNLSTAGNLKWFSGFNLNLKHYEFKFGISQENGFLNSAKGFSFGISNTFKF